MVLKGGEYMKTFKINDKISIDAEYYETRYSWGHKAYLYINGEQVGYKKATYYNRTWESYQFQSVMESVVDANKKLFTKEEFDFTLEYLKNYQESDSSLKRIATIASLGEVFGTTQKEKNDWKKRMLNAGLGNKGLDFPDDWDTLSEDDKEARLNGAIDQLK